MKTAQHTQDLRERMIQGIQEMAAFESYTKDMPQNTAMHHYMRERFTQAGLRPLEGQDDFVFSNEGYPTLVGVKGRGQGPTVALMFHYDVTPDESDWHIENKHQPELFTKKDFLHAMNDDEAALASDDLLVGKGVADMLGAAEAMLQTAAMIAEDFPGRLMLMAMPDEEVGSQNGMQKVLPELQEMNALPQVMVGSESTFMDVLVRRRGHMKYYIELATEEQEVHPHIYKVRTIGKNMHSGSFNWSKIDKHAFLNMAHALEEIGEHQVLEAKGGIVYNVIPNNAEFLIATPQALNLQDYDEHVEIEAVEQTTVQHKVIVNLKEALMAFSTLKPTVEAQSDYGAFVMPNVIDNNIISVDCRVMQGNFDTLQAEIVSAIEQAGAQVVSVSDITPPVKPFFSDRDHTAVQLAKDVMNKAGWPTEANRENYGASDLNFIYPYDIIGFEIGPVGANEHGANEWLCLKSITALPFIYRDIVGGLQKC